jgi:hypothetical protein
MAASKPTSSLSKQNHILSTESHLGALAGGLGCCPLDYEAYPPQSECRGTGSLGIRSLIGFGSLVGPLSHSVLYLLEYWPDTRPQAISERTSYHGV